MATTSVGIIELDRSRLSIQGSDVPTEDTFSSPGLRRGELFRCPRRRQNPPMSRVDWKTRCDDAGLTMPTLARLTNRGTTTLAKQVELGAISHPVIATILAYEMMLPWQRRKWVEEVERVTDGG